MSNEHILALIIISKATYCCLVFVHKATIKNYATNFNSNIKFNRLFDAALAFVAIKELFFTLFDEESFIYKQVITNSLQKQ